MWVRSVPLCACALRARPQYASMQSSPSAVIIEGIPELGIEPLPTLSARSLAVALARHFEPGEPGVSILEPVHID